MTFMNYFTVGIPGILFSYWTLRPLGKVRPADDTSFFKRVLPFAAWSALLQAVGATVIFVLSPAALTHAASNPLVLITFIAFGFMFFACAPGVYREHLATSQKFQLLGTAIVEIALLYGAFHWPLALRFFTITPITIPALEIVKVGVIIFIFCVFQFFLARRFKAHE